MRGNWIMIKMKKTMRFMRFISYVCCMRGWGEVVIIWYYRVMFVYIGRGEDVIIW